MAILLFLPVVTQAQQPAAITGTLTDPSGAAIAGARVSAQFLDAPNAPAKETSSAADGAFTLTLAPGRYRVSVQHPAFARAEQEFTLAAGESRVWDVR
ncbi:MAG: carboxypeptidase-like regulatory domain-containing protein, partial [Candidatus Acidiferrales bacterium]